MIDKSTNTQAKRFLSVGIATVLLDYLVYVTLVYLFGLNEWFKAFSFGFGALFSFVCNSYFTFSQSRLHVGKLFKFILTYYVSMNVNLFINSISLKSISLPIAYAITVAFFLATSASAVVNFLMLKYFVYK